MNRRIAIIIGFVFTVSIAAHFITKESMAQDPVVADRYCAELQDGKMVLMQDNKPVMAEVALNDGSKVTTACIVIRKDGTIVALKTGDCIDKDGNINNMTAPQTPIKK